MPRFRRLCLDIDDWNVAVGGSVEYYDDTQNGATACAVLEVPKELGLSQEQVLQQLRDLGWPQEALPFNWPRA
jgi:hypothetical protein